MPPSHAIPLPRISSTTFIYSCRKIVFKNRATLPTLLKGSIVKTVSRFHISIHYDIIYRIKFTIEKADLHSAFFFPPVKNSLNASFTVDQSTILRQIFIGVSPYSFVYFFFLSPICPQDTFQFFQIRSCQFICSQFINSQVILMFFQIGLRVSYSFASHCQNGVIPSFSSRISSSKPVV